MFHTKRVEYIHAKKLYDFKRKRLLEHLLQLRQAFISRGHVRSTLPSLSSITDLFSPGFGLS